MWFMVAVYLLGISF